jgi:hypothetical protein
MKEGNGLYHIIYWHPSKKKNETWLGFWSDGCNLILLKDPGIFLEKLFLKGRYSLLQNANLFESLIDFMFIKLLLKSLN